MLTDLECKRALHDIVYRRLNLAMSKFDDAKREYEATAASIERVRLAAKQPGHESLPLGYEKEQADEKAAVGTRLDQAGREVKVWNEVFKYLLDNIVGREFNFKTNPVPVAHWPYAGD